MINNKLYIFAGNAKEAEDYARSFRIKPEQYVYVCHKDILRGIERGSSYVLTGSCSSRSDFIDLEEGIREREMKKIELNSMADSKKYAHISDMNPLSLLLATGLGIDHHLFRRDVLSLRLPKKLLKEPHIRHQGEKERIRRQKQKDRACSR